MNFKKRAKARAEAAARKAAASAEEAAVSKATQAAEAVLKPEELLTPGESLRPGQCITSHTGNRKRLCLQGSTLAVYGGEGKVLPGGSSAAGVARLEFEAGPPSRLCYVYTMAERVCSDSPEFRPLPAMTEFINGPLRLADGKSYDPHTRKELVDGAPAPAVIDGATVYDDAYRAGVAVERAKRGASDRSMAWA